VDKQKMTTALATKDDWILIQKQCQAFLQSGFLPNHVKTMAQAITIAWKGHELGIPPLQAFSSITVINGKPCLSSELMLALIYSRVKGAKVTFKTPPEKQSQECTIEMQRPGGDPQVFRFSMDDAKRAGLLGKPNSAWEKYAQSMLRARAISAGARAVFPDAIMGCYTPEEMGAEPIEIEAEISTPKPEQATTVVEHLEENALKQIDEEVFGKKKDNTGH
jgi:hypothetical protein